ncbi:uncharacterized membrane protein YidH (DUF202 family) [Motilibacter peucedani]|uniref:Uncharacterized membrane protein YidH (DUF202 family) n=1 Tax=Motilibacter peucedani TaxID=598650 RepID=A0A420XSM5_9ACTN|nr:DUF202 domain-containing protein [Motilibacter peucedani]RKS77830.1 uncharacterized membrane protein YidH (DUF202 family) [Motilibacter peucedani]
MSSDPGLQPERTTLAWSRTALSVCGCVLGMLRLATPDDLASRAVGGSLALAGAVVLLAARRRVGELRRARPGAPSPAVVLCLAVGLAGAGAGALVLQALAGS